MLICHPSVVLGEVSVQIFCPLLNLTIGLLVVLLLSCESTFWIQVLCQISILQILSPNLCLALEGPVGVSNAVHMCVCPCECVGLKGRETQRERLASSETPASEFSSSLLTSRITERQYPEILPVHVSTSSCCKQGA